MLIDLAAAAFSFLYLFEKTDKNIERVTENQ